MLPRKTEILIVGAGPTGLALAVGLKQAGVDHVLIDALPHGQNTSRAAVIHAHTLEALDSLGVAETLKRRGLLLSRFAIRDRSRPLLEIGFGDLPSPHQGMLMIPQCDSEAIFAERLAALGGQIHRNVRATEIHATPDGALARVATAEGDRTIEARFIVGGDGMHSLVRQAADIGFDGGNYAESFILADVRMDWPFGATEVSLFFSPSGLLVVAPLPDGSFRIVATMDDAPATPGIADVDRLLAERGPVGTSTVREVVWSSRFRLHHRLAQTYRRGPFLIMGDAAHVHSPAGGQGMNTGLVDAVTLAEALISVVRDKAGEHRLEYYSELRRPAAEAVLGLAGRLTSMAMLRSPVARTLRNLVLRMLNHVPRFKQIMKMSLSGLSRRSLARAAPMESAPKLEARLPEPSSAADLRQAA